MSELSKQAGILSLSEFFRFFIKTIIGIALARLLSPADLGTYRQLFLIYTTVSAVLLLGIPQSLLYFMPKAQDAAEQGKIIKRTLFMAVLLSIVCAAGMFLCRGLVANKFNNPQLLRLLPLFALYPISMFYTQIYSSILLGMKEAVKAASFTIFAIFSDLVLILGTALFTRNLRFIVMGVLAASFIQLSYAMIKLSGLKALKQKLDLRGIQIQLNYALPLGLSSLVGMLSIQLDKIMVSGFFTPEQFAVFSVGAMELPLIGILANSVNAVILPSLSSSSKSEGGTLYSAAVRKNALIILPLAMLFYLLAEPLMVFLYGVAYADAAQYFKIYLFTLPLRVATYGIIFQALGKTRIILINASFALLANAILNYLLIRKMGMAGAALATVIVSWLSVAFYLVIMKQVLKLELRSYFPWRKLGKTLLVTMLCGIITYPVASIGSQPIIQLIFGSLFFSMAFLVFGKLLGVILDYDLQLVVSFLKDGLKRIKK